MRNYFSPRPGRYGISSVLASPGILVTGTLAAGTLTFNLGGYPTVAAALLGAAISAATYPTATTVTARLLKRDVSAAADVPLTGLVVINAQAAGRSTQMPLLTTLTDDQLTLAPEDRLFLEIVTTGAVTVQPVGLVPVVELGTLY